MLGLAFSERNALEDDGCNVHCQSQCYGKLDRPERPDIDAFNVFVSPECRKPAICDNSKDSADFYSAVLGPVLV